MPFNTSDRNIILIESVRPGGGKPDIGSSIIGGAAGYAVSSTVSKLTSLSGINATIAANNKFIDASRLEGNFYRDGSIVDIADHFGKFYQNAALLMPEESFGKYPVVGRPDGLFVTSPEYMNMLLEKTKGDNSLIKKQLGIEPQYWNNSLVRIDIPSPLF